SCQRRDFGLSLRFWFTGDEFHAAGRAPGLAATGMQLIDSRVLFQREHEPLAKFHIERTFTLNGQLWHLSPGRNSDISISNFKSQISNRGSPVLLVSLPNRRNEIVAERTFEVVRGIEAP